jgi:methylated-DNA-[protein]-cysteine S-methyltransferase
MMDLVTLPVTTFETALGRCAVRWTGSGIAGVLLPTRSGRHGPRIEDGVEVPDHVREAIDGMTAVLAGEPRDLRQVVLDQRSIDPFRREVYAATREIPAGTTRSYGDVARTIGRPDAARDVGTALARNPCPIIVPCHRVVAGNGLGGFSGGEGVESKRWLRTMEGYLQPTLDWD